MLGLLEHCVTDLGGSYAYGDTDSLAIVDTCKGGLAPCRGGDRRLGDGSGAIRENPDASRSADIKLIGPGRTERDARGIRPHERTVVESPGPVSRGKAVIAERPI